MGYQFKGFNSSLERFVRLHNEVFDAFASDEFDYLKSVTITKGLPRNWLDLRSNFMSMSRDEFLDTYDDRYCDTEGGSMMTVYDSAIAIRNVIREKLSELKYLEGELSR